MLICFSAMFICTAASSLASLSVRVDSTDSEKYRSGIVQSLCFWLAENATSSKSTDSLGSLSLLLPQGVRSLRSLSDDEGVLGGWRKAPDP